MPCEPELTLLRSMATMLPSRPRPARTSITAIGRTKPNWNSSARLQCTLTGDAVAMARRAASMASSPRFPPYPPPVGGTMTRDLAGERGHRAGRGDVHPGPADAGLRGPHHDQPVAEDVEVLPVPRVAPVPGAARPGQRLRGFAARGFRPSRGAPGAGCRGPPDRAGDPRVTAAPADGGLRASEMARWSGMVSAASSAAARSAMAGVQYPHWKACSSARACWTGCSRRPEASPSTVVTDVLPPPPPSVWQASTGVPSTSTVHAAHSPSP